MFYIRESIFVNFISLDAELNVILMQNN